MTKEIWRLVPNYTNYMVSNLGNVESLNYRRTGKEQLLLKSITNEYYYVCLHKNGKPRFWRVNVLVAMAFLGHIPCGMLRIVDHKNDIKTDNSVENLQILTQRGNAWKTASKKTTAFPRGVAKRGNTFQSVIAFNGKTIYLGMFPTEEDASNAYQKALSEIEEGIFVVPPSRRKPKDTQ